MSEKKLVVGTFGTKDARKTALVNLYTRPDEGYIPTIEDEFTKTIELDGRKVTMELIDTAGQDDYKEMAMGYYRAIHAAVVLYSISDKTSLAAAETIYKEMKDARGGSFPCVIAGTDEDLREGLGSDAVPEQEGIDLANKYGCKHMLVSVTTGLGVNELFDTVVREYFAQEGSKKEHGKSKNKGKKAGKDKHKDKGGCDVQ